MADWQKSLSRVVETRDGKSKLAPLDQARAFVIKQPERNEWNFAAGELMSAAETGSAADSKRQPNL